MRKPVLCLCEQQGADPRSLIGAFVFRFLDSVIPLVSLSKISRLLLASEAEQAGLSPTWSDNSRLINNVLALLHFRTFWRYSLTMIPR